MFRARWNGEALVPTAPYGLMQAREAMQPGDIVAVEIDHPRSPNSHRHQFAEIADAWGHLPEALAGMPWAATPETLRKHALIATGFSHSSSVDCGSNAAAQRVAPALHAQAAAAHGYAITVIRGPVVLLYTPMSQSIRAMGGKEFQRSKQAVLDWIADKIGVGAGAIGGK